MNDKLSEELIGAYLDGEVTPDEQALVERELGDNPERSRLLEELRGIRAELQSLPALSLPASFADRVVAQALKARAAASELAPQSQNEDQEANSSGSYSTSSTSLTVIGKGAMTPPRQSTPRLPAWRYVYLVGGALAASLALLLLYSPPSQPGKVAVGPERAGPKGTGSDGVGDSPQLQTRARVAQNRSLDVVQDGAGDSAEALAEQGDRSADRALFRRESMFDRKSDAGSILADQMESLPPSLGSAASGSTAAGDTAAGDTAAGAGGATTERETVLSESLAGRQAGAGRAISPAPPGEGREEGLERAVPSIAAAAPGLAAGKAGVAGEGAAASMQASIESAASSQPADYYFRLTEAPSPAGPLGFATIDDAGDSPAAGGLESAAPGGGAATAGGSAAERFAKPLANGEDAGRGGLPGGEAFAGDQGVPGAGGLGGFGGAAPLAGGGMGFGGGRGFGGSMGIGGGEASDSASAPESTGYRTVYFTIDRQAFEQGVVEKLLVQNGISQQSQHNFSSALAAEQRSFSFSDAVAPLSVTPELESAPSAEGLEAATPQPAAQPQAASPQADAEAGAPGVSAPQLFALFASRAKVDAVLADLENSPGVRLEYQAAPSSRDKLMLDTAASSRYVESPGSGASPGIGASVEAPIASAPQQQRGLGASSGPAPSQLADERADGQLLERKQSVEELGAQSGAAIAAADRPPASNAPQAESAREQDKEQSLEQRHAEKDQRLGAALDAGASTAAPARTLAQRRARTQPDKQSRAARPAVESGGKKATARSDAIDKATARSEAIDKATARSETIDKATARSDAIDDADKLSPEQKSQEKASIARSDARSDFVPADAIRAKSESDEAAEENVELKKQVQPPPVGQRSAGGARRLVENRGELRIQTAPQTKDLSKGRQVDALGEADRLQSGQSVADPERVLLYVRVVDSQDAVIEPASPAASSPATGQSPPP